MRSVAAVLTMCYAAGILARDDFDNDDCVDAVGWFMVACAVEACSCAY